MATTDLTPAATPGTESHPVTLDRRSDAGEVLDTVVLDPSMFAVSPNVPLMHQVVTAQLAARRSGTQSTKTRAEVAGGASKPYRQKGTGRARQGTIRAPQFAGGGVALGPKPRSYAQRTPRKMIRQALHCALSDRAAEGRICLVDRWSFEVPKTKDAVRALQALGCSGSVLVVLGPDDAIAERSFANLPQVDLVEGGQLTAYDVLVSDWIVFTNATLPGEVAVVEGSAEAAADKASAARSAAAEQAAADEAEQAAADEAAQAAADKAAQAAADVAEPGEPAADEQPEDALAAEEPDEVEASTEDEDSDEDEHSDEDEDGEEGE